jgi:hypothetical protein
MSVCFSTQVVLISAASFLTLNICQSPASGQPLTIHLKGTANVVLVGAVHRWDANGEARRRVDPKARIDRPETDAQATKIGTNTWQFRELPPARYDLVIVTQQKRRIEGFHYPPVLEFDPFLFHEEHVPDQARNAVTTLIRNTRHYENKVTPLFFAGDDQHVRVFVRLLRDKPTSYDATFGEPIVTIRHEVWQFTNQYGGWVKERRTKIFNRLLLAKREWSRWAWSWDPDLGGVEVTGDPVDLTYRIP